MIFKSIAANDDFLAQVFFLTSGIEAKQIEFMKQKKCCQKT